MGRKQGIENLKRNMRSNYKSDFFNEITRGILSLKSCVFSADITGYVALTEVICTLPKGNKHTLKGAQT